MKKGKNRFFSSCFFSRLVLQKKKEGWGLARPFSFHFSLSLALVYKTTPRFSRVLLRSSQRLERLPDEQAAVKLHARQRERSRRRARAGVRARGDDSERPPRARRGGARDRPRAVAAGVVECGVVDVAAEQGPALLRLRLCLPLLLLLIFFVSSTTSKISTTSKTSCSPSSSSSPASLRRTPFSSLRPSTSLASSPAPRGTALASPTKEKKKEWQRRRQQRGSRRRFRPRQLWPPPPSRATPLWPPPPSRATPLWPPPEEPCPRRR